MHITLIWNPVSQSASGKVVMLHHIFYWSWITRQEYILMWLVCALCQVPEIIFNHLLFGESCALAGKFFAKITLKSRANA